MVRCGYGVGHTVPMIVNDRRWILQNAFVNWRRQWLRVAVISVRAVHINWKHLMFVPSAKFEKENKVVNFLRIHR